MHDVSRTRVTPTVDDTSALHNFFAAYFHEDCLDDYATWQEIVENFARDVDVETVKTTIDELQSFLAKPQSDEELSSVLFRKLGCYYSPPGPAVLTRSWLEDVLTHLRESAV